MPDGGTMRASVIVVSRHRPRDLARCLSALLGQSHPQLELVLVADPASVGMRPELPIKRVAFEQANISAARNAGLAQAAGDVVLFIDDDALAAPGWAARLTAAFADPRVNAATGFTRGPDGLAWQVRAERITPSGRGYAIPVTQASLLAPQDGHPVSTVGTNCAFRRAALLQIGGFDAGFPYHLDESDVNMRLAAHCPDALTAVIPEAQVIHGLAAGTSRAGVGVPHDLTAIGRSTVIFAARHGGDAGWLRQAQRQRLLRLMVAGRMEPSRVASILRTLDAGMADAPRDLPPPQGWPHPEPPAFLPLGNAANAPLFLAGWHWQRRGLRKRAAQTVAQGGRVMILLLTPSFLPHRLSLGDGGWWEQRGGIWGASQPDDSPVMRYRLRDRIDRERMFFATDGTEIRQEVANSS